MIPSLWKRKFFLFCHHTMLPGQKNLITSPWEPLSKVFSIKVGLCPLTHHSDASSKGSRGRSNTATNPYNGILAPRKAHSEVLTVPRRSVLWQLLPRQGICPVGNSRRDHCCVLDGMDYWSSLFSVMANRHSWLGITYEGLKDTFVGWVVPTASTIMFVPTTSALTQLSTGSSVQFSNYPRETTYLCIPHGI